jgi:3-hydroxybutyryl-CoA dehydrogenase
MDLTCYDPEEFYHEFPQLKGAFAALFADEEKKIEIHLKEKSQDVLDKLLSLGFKPTVTTIISCGFIFPRTIAQIINEAYFALEEEVASKEDINRAMKFGVNYPKGPFEWSQGKEKFAMALLNELYQKNQDKRYLAASLLKKAAV